MPRKSLAGLCAALCLATGAQARAQSAPATTVAVAAQSPMSAVEQKDMAVVQAAEADVSRGGPSAIARHRKELLKVVAHAPAEYPLMERRGDVVIVRDDVDPQGAMVQSLIGAALAGRSMSVARGDNVYGQAYLMLMSYANEIRRPQDALQYADAGLKMQPGYGALVAEKATALVSLHRMSEAPPLIDGWLAQHTQADPRFRALLLRTKGFALIESGRLDDAEAAYNQSLQLQPGHPGAEAELKYIAGLRAGRSNAPFGILTAPAAAAGERPKVQAP